MQSLQNAYPEPDDASADLSFLGSVDSEKLAFAVTIFMAVLSVVIDTVEIATSVFTGDYSAQISRILIEVIDGVPPLDIDEEDILDGDDDEDDSVNKEKDGEKKKLGHDVKAT